MNATEATRRPGHAGTLKESHLWVEDIVKTFPITSGMLRKKQTLRALDTVSFNVFRGETFGLVGESGCGKSTLARCILRLVEPTSGRVLFDGEDVGSLDRHKLRALRRRMQIVFQDPFASLDPRMTALAIVEEPLIVHRVDDRTARRSRALEVIGQVGLTTSQAERKPHAFSGGQRQRIGIARALVSQPEIVILDEPLSALDVSVQAQVLNLLRNLQHHLDLTYVFISHDLAVAEYFCDRLAVLYLGQVMELADRTTIFQAPLHPYTVSLLAAVPAPGGTRQRGPRRAALTGEVTPLGERSIGCPFEPRCPVGKGRSVCSEQRPQLVEPGLGHWVACHFPGEFTPELALAARQGAAIALGTRDASGNGARR